MDAKEVLARAYYQEKTGPRPGPRCRWCPGLPGNHHPECPVPALEAEVTEHEATKADLRRDIRFWRGWAVMLEPRLDALAEEQHITAEDIKRVDELGLGRMAKLAGGK